jgi:hypothetical protein
MFLFSEEKWQDFDVGAVFCVFLEIRKVYSPTGCRLATAVFAL